MKKAHNGITLVALVITIIILLILAGITISLIMQGGIVDKAQEATKQYTKAQIKEEIEIEIANIQAQKSMQGESLEIEDLSQLESIGVKLDLTTDPIKGEYKGNTITIDSNFVVTVGEKEEIEIEGYTYIYIDANNGNDTTGNGSKQKPYQTIEKLGEKGIIEKGQNYRVRLREGEYNLSTTIFSLDYDGEIAIEGEKQKTILRVGPLFANVGQYVVRNHKVSFYRLVWQGTYNHSNELRPDVDMDFYNVVFEITKGSGGGYAYFDTEGLSKATTCNFYHCVLTKHITEFFRTEGTNKGTIKAINCYGGFTSGYHTSDSEWNYQTNLITQTPNLDENYHILDDEKLWKGAGLDLDGTKTNIGVYGGQYSWSN